MTDLSARCGSVGDVCIGGGWKNSDRSFKRGKDNSPRRVVHLILGAAPIYCYRRIVHRKTLRGRKTVPAGCFIREKAGYWVICWKSVHIPIAGTQGAK